jgi:hypothetical protein
MLSSYAFTLMMLEGRFPIESQVSLSGVIASNSAKLANANFWGVTLAEGTNFAFSGWVSVHAHVQ